MSMQTFHDQDWQSLHVEIQNRFRALAAEVAPNTQPRYGKTVTKLFPLFSHVSFSHAMDGTSNEIIVGVDIGLEKGQWRIDADIADEEEGTIFFELPNTPFSVSSFAELRQRVLGITDELIAGGKPVLLQLFGLAAPIAPGPMPSLPDLAHKS